MTAAQRYDFEIAIQSEACRQDGAALLAFLGVKAPDKELCEVAAEVRGHALTLTLLGTYLRKACHGDLRGWREMPLLEQAVRRCEEVRERATQTLGWSRRPPRIGAAVAFDR